ncbi:MAG: cation-translocating P-type ATPase [Dehalococcoidia bacterium]
MTFTYSPPALGLRSTLPDLDVLVRQLGVDASRGLSSAEAQRRLASDGPNEPTPIQAPSWLAILRHQFASKLIWILALATAVSVGLGDWLNAAAIGVTVVFTTLIGFINELRSERAISALRDLTARRAEVIRDGALSDIAAREVVVGDLVFVNEGDIIPADARVLESRALSVNESILTGEPESVIKSAAVQAFPDEDRATPATQVFAGTTVVAGSARCLVVGTAAATALGQVFRAVERGERPPTPLEERLDELGNRLIVVFLAITAAIVAVGFAQGRDFRLVVETAVSLAIGAVPEGLPAVATVALAVAVRRLASRHVLVRTLGAVETLGSTTIIVTDKTGTLTENRMVLRSVLISDGTEISVDVSFAGPEARTTFTGRGLADLTDAEGAEVRRVLLLAALCNDAVAEYDGESGWHAHGDPMEGALALAAAGLGLGNDALMAAYPRVETEPFSSSTRMMRTVHQTNGGMLHAIKGAVEPVARFCTGPDQNLLDRISTLGSSGLRILAVAEQENGDAAVLRGAVVLDDPLRPDAAEATAAVRAAGLNLMLVTGDQLTTATSIASQTGILRDDASAILGQELDSADLARVAVVARATHEQKEQIVRRLQGLGEIVAMTGDGVNDAAALRSAHVGVAVGPGATDVAVEASDIVLADGSLLSLVEGIREGRQVTDSLRRAIVYLLTASFGTIGLIALAIAANQPLPLGALQILWLNVAVHVFPALALATSV